MAVKPITPDEVAWAKAEAIPDVVLEVFNRLIVANFANGQASFTLDEAVAALAAATGSSRSEMVKKGWLDVEPIYEESGWKVTFDRPGYNETYPATFTFKRRRDGKDR